MAEYTTSVSIDIADFLESCSSYEIECIKQSLNIGDYEEHKREHIITYTENDSDFDKACFRLHNNNWRLSLLDQQTIIDISKKIVQS